MVTVTTAGGTGGAQTFTINVTGPGAPTLTSVARMKASTGPPQVRATGGPTKDHPRRGVPSGPGKDANNVHQLRRYERY